MKYLVRVDFEPDMLIMEVFNKIDDKDILYTERKPEVVSMFFKYHTNDNTSMEYYKELLSKDEVFFRTKVKSISIVAREEQDILSFKPKPKKFMFKVTFRGENEVVGTKLKDAFEELGFGDCGSWGSFLAQEKCYMWTYDENHPIKLEIEELNND